MHRDAIKNPPCSKPVFRFALAIAGCCFIAAGCKPAIEREIEESRDKWGSLLGVGASTNQWALFKRVCKIGDPEERIRLTRKFQRRYIPLALADPGTNSPYAVYTRCDFIKECGFALAYDKSRNPKLTIAGWELLSDWLDMMEEIIRRTQGDLEKTENANPFTLTYGDKERRFYANQMRKEYRMFFKMSCGIINSLKRIPPSHRLEFIELIRKKILPREGMRHCDSKFLPKFLLREMGRDEKGD